MSREIDNSTTIVGDFNTPPLIMNKTTKRKMGKEIEALNNTMNPPKTHLQNTPPTAAEYRFFSDAHKTFSSISYMLDHKTNLNQFKRREITQNMFSDYCGIKLEIKKQKENCKTQICGN